MLIVISLSIITMCVPRCVSYTSLRLFIFSQPATYRMVLAVCRDNGIVVIVGMQKFLRILSFDAMLIKVSHTQFTDFYMHMQFDVSKFEFILIFFILIFYCIVSLFFLYFVHFIHSIRLMINVQLTQHMFTCVLLV